MSYYFWACIYILRIIYACFVSCFCNLIHVFLYAVFMLSLLSLLLLSQGKSTGIYVYILFNVSYYVCLLFCTSWSMMLFTFMVYNICIMTTLYPILLFNNSNHLIISFYLIWTKMCILIKILVITYVPVSDFHVVLETRHFISTC